MPVRSIALAALHDESVTVTVTATRAVSKLTATAAAAPAWKFADFGMSVPRVVSVLSIEDDIRVEIALVATETGSKSYTLARSGGGAKA